ncbi:uncharacterized protein LOC135821860 [Sycon ciliatum]|uniref:uncharacterized protein LOC135821860 n=1 Tax=Sycon ciliatum TaxID=27933 RepID=UPI0031F6AAD6
MSAVAQPALPAPPPQSARAAVGQDLWRQLKRVSIPVFRGDKKQFPSWKAAFLACIDQAPLTAEYKMLQLREYLAGDALRAVENLGHSAAAYEAAKTRLERKFGTSRRQVSLYLEELDRFRPIRPESAKDVEQFADLLDVAVINLKDMQRTEELGNGSLYAKLLSKMTEAMVVNYQRWLYENHEPENVETLLTWVNREAEFAVIAAESVRGVTSQTRQQESSTARPRDVSSHGRGADRRTSHHTFVSSSTSGDLPSRNRSCPACGQGHPVWRCPTFQSQSVTRRWATARGAALCYRCLGSGHSGANCTRSRTCGIDGCTETHNRLLHSSNSDTSMDPAARKPAGAQSSNNQGIAKPRAAPSQPDRSGQMSGPPSSVMNTEGESVSEAGAHARTHHGQQVEPQTALRTVPVTLVNGNRKIAVNALLDDGSTVSYMNSSIAAELGLAGEQKSITVSVLNGAATTFNTASVNCQISSSDGRARYDFTAWTTNNVTASLKAINWNNQRDRWQHLREVPFPPLNGTKHIDILIGVDHPYLHASLDEIAGAITSLNGHSTTTASLEQLNQVVQRFWEIDQSGTQLRSHVQLTTAEQQATDRVATSLIGTSSGRYEIQLPWNARKVELRNNYAMALRRLSSTEKRLQHSSEVAAAYSQAIDDYVHKGYVEQVQAADIANSGWFLPHFPIVRMDKSTTKVRMVFDAAAHYQGISLNDAILPGPKLQRELFDVLLRFRRNSVALVCDVKEMYLQIEIHPDDRKHLRFLWRTQDEVNVYQFNRLVFGLNVSPFIAHYVIQNHARQHAVTHPRGAEAVLESTYMDDTLDSVESDEKAVELYHQLSFVWSTAGMKARKWLSNSPTVLQSVPQEDRQSSIDLSGELPTTKTLGVQWRPDSDQFGFTFSKPADNNITKRLVVRHIATVFDPLGFLAPFVVRGKICIQEMWVAGLDWDTPAPEAIAGKARAWLNELCDTDAIQIPRCLYPNSEAPDKVLHVFTDASTLAYGTVCYAVSTLADGQVCVRMVAAKTHVAPLKTISVPRLELMGAMLGLQLAQSTAEALKIPKSAVVYWSDSVDVLCWIRNPSRIHKPFVAHRIGEIQLATQPEQWRYVPTKCNPADLASRGTSVTSLITSQLWWEGPQFLQQEQSTWPPAPAQLSLTDNAKQEVKKDHRATASQSQQQQTFTGSITAADLGRLDPARYSEFNRLLHVTAWVFRFIQNCRTPASKLVTSTLTADELKDARTYHCRTAQQQALEYNTVRQKNSLPKASSLRQFQPFIDADGLMRVGGRLQHAEFLSFDQQCPIILPKGHRITQLIIKSYHDCGNHTCGVNHMLSELSNQYWLLGGRDEIRSCESNCARCKLRKASPAEQVMAPLPKVRVSLPLRAFARVAVDYAGPFTTKQGRGKTRAKRYLCLFACHLTRAVHLELAYGLDVDSFLQAYHRFTNRRGTPVEVTSDNGTNFVGANNELRELAEALDVDKLQRSMAQEGTRWHFNPPSGPHFGGAHEALIKVAKRALSATLSNRDTTDEELYTAITGAEALMNSRPLGYQSADPRDPLPLTPNHFLHGQQGMPFVPAGTDETQWTLKQRWRMVQDIVLQFWRRWMKEIVPELNRRKKWTQTKPDLTVGDVVLVVSPDTARGEWPLARVAEVYPGSDGHVRVVKIKVRGKYLTRPITQLCRIDAE